MPFTNPFHKVRCPFCNSQIRLGDCAIVSNVESGKILRDPSQGSYSRLLSRVWLNPLDGPMYTQELASRQCPVCRKSLPYNIGQVDNLTIAVVGDISSGKSHYIAALIKELKEWQTKRYVRFIGLTQDSEERYIKNYYRSLFVERESLPPTQLATGLTREPLIYEMVIQETSPLQSSKRINVIIYDASGEDISNQDRMVKYSQYILNSSAIIFLADPLAIPGINDMLPPHLRTATLPARRPSDVLNLVLQTFERNNQLKAGAPLPIPVAIMLSKSDLLKYLRPVGQQFTLFTNPTYSDSIDLEDLQAINDEVKKVITDFGDHGLLQIAERLAKVNFFATSATGYPQDAGGRFPAIEPFRCLDPLLWILWELHIINAT